MIFFILFSPLFSFEMKGNDIFYFIFPSVFLSSQRKWYFLFYFPSCFPMDGGGDKIWQIKLEMGPLIFSSFSPLFRALGLILSVDNQRKYWFMILPILFNALFLLTPCAFFSQNQILFLNLGVFPARACRSLPLMPFFHFILGYFVLIFFLPSHIGWVGALCSTTCRSFPENSDFLFCLPTSALCLPCVSLVCHFQLHQPI